MTRPAGGYLLSRATGRNVLIVLTLSIVLALLSKFVMAAIFRGVAGFEPFDLQASLSRNMLAIELGTMDKGAATGFYIPFMVIDEMFAVASAFAYALFWAWLFAKVPTRVFYFLSQGGILLTPFAAIFCDLAAKGGFVRLLHGLSGPAYAATIEFSVTAHRLKYAFVDLRNYLSLAFVLVACISLALVRTSGKSSA